MNHATQNLNLVISNIKIECAKMKQQEKKSTEKEDAIRIESAKKHFQKLYEEQGLTGDKFDIPLMLAKIYLHETKGKKGILLSGKTGCGKTARMRLLEPHIRMESAQMLCRRLANAEITSGAWTDTLNLPVFGAVSSACFYDLIIDDLGEETENFNVFGTKRDVMAEILDARYNAQFREFVDKNGEKQHCLTHVTTNLSPDQFRARYGDRIADRMKEMFIFVNVDGESWRGRK